MLQQQQLGQQSGRKENEPNPDSPRSQASPAMNLILDEEAEFVLQEIETHKIRIKDSEQDVAESQQIIDKILQESLLDGKASTILINSAEEGLYTLRTSNNILRDYELKRWQQQQRVNEGISRSIDDAMIVTVDEVNRMAQAVRDARILRKRVGELTKQRDDEIMDKATDKADDILTNAKTKLDTYNNEEDQRYNDGEKEYQEAEENHLAELEQFQQDVQDFGTVGFDDAYNDVVPRGLKFQKEEGDTLFHIAEKDNRNSRETIKRREIDLIQKMENIQTKLDNLSAQEKIEYEGYQSRVNELRKRVVASNKQGVGRMTGGASKRSLSPSSQGSNSPGSPHSPAINQQYGQQYDEYGMQVSPLGDGKNLAVSGSKKSVKRRGKGTLSQSAEGRVIIGGQVMAAPATLVNQKLTAVIERKEQDMNDQLTKMRDLENRAESLLQQELNKLRGMRNRKEILKQILEYQRRKERREEKLIIEMGIFQKYLEAKLEHPHVQSAGQEILKIKRRKRKEQKVRELRKWNKQEERRRRDQRKLKEEEQKRKEEEDREKMLQQYERLEGGFDDNNYFGTNQQSIEQQLEEAKNRTAQSTIDQQTPEQLKHKKYQDEQKELDIQNLTSDERKTLKKQSNTIKKAKEQQNVLKFGGEEDADIDDEDDTDWRHDDDVPPDDELTRRDQYSSTDRDNINDINNKTGDDKIIEEGSGSKS
ncbi:MAG: hypothetical protein EZS28_022252, partial [Streblomastix strix]